MNDMSSTIVAKSDQINAADLIGMSRTVTVKEVRIKAGDDQPVTVLVEEDRKAFRPCKGVRRLMVRVWGPDASKYIGQSMTLFCDPTVTWAGKEEGGIRVSHMSGLNSKIVEFMRTSRAATKPYEILPLRQQHADQGQQQAKRQTAEEWTDEYIGLVEKTTVPDALIALQSRKKSALASLEKDHPLLFKRAVEAGTKQAVKLSPAFEPEGRDDREMGEGFNDDPFVNDMQGAD